MSYKTQITQLGVGVEDFARCVHALDEDLFLETLGRWSPRDIVAHLVGWNRYIIKGIKQIKKGELPFYDIDPGENYSNVNAVLIREYPSRERQDLLNELEASARELVQFLESVDPEEWDRDYGVRHRGINITIQNTVEELTADYVHHKEQIVEWAKRREA